MAVACPVNIRYACAGFGRAAAWKHRRRHPYALRAQYPPNFQLVNATGVLVFRTRHLAAHKPSYFI
jgi:hypothetical protein